MKQIIAVLLLLSAVLMWGACSARPVKQGTLATKNQEGPEPLPLRKVVGQITPAQLEELRALNEKAGAPRFGLIRGFYQLPEIFPAGAVRIEEGLVFGQPYRSYKLSKLGSSPYAIAPMSPRQGEVLSKTITTLLTAGLKFADVSMADAVKIIEAERRALQKKQLLFPGQQVPSGVDLLVSIQSGQGESGPVYVGRVIRTKDGALLALAYEPDYGIYALRPLLMRLVQDALVHLNP